MSSRGTLLPALPCGAGAWLTTTPAFCKSVGVMNNDTFRVRYNGVVGGKRREWLYAKTTVRGVYIYDIIYLYIYLYTYGKIANFFLMLVKLCMHVVDSGALPSSISWLLLCLTSFADNIFGNFFCGFLHPRLLFVPVGSLIPLESLSRGYPSGGDAVVQLAIYFVVCLAFMLLKGLRSRLCRCWPECLPAAAMG